MNAKQFFKELEKAEKAQSIINGFMESVEGHFIKLGIFDVTVTYCAGDGFLIMDARNKGDVYPVNNQIVESLFSLKDEVEVFAFFDTLKKQGSGI